MLFRSPQGQWGTGTLAVALPEAGGRVATVTFDGRVSVPEGAEPGALDVPLLPADVALEEVTVNGSPGALSRGGGRRGSLPPRTRPAPRRRRPPGRP